MILDQNYGENANELWLRMVADNYIIPNIFLNTVYAYKDMLDFSDIDTFIETGTSYGHTTEVASYHFNEVISYEKFPSENVATFQGKNMRPYIWNMRERLDYLNNLPNVTINYEDSIVGLNKYFKDNPDKRCLILLDAHNGYESNLRGELLAIKNSNIDNNIIVIDDMVDIGRGSWPRYDEFINLVKSINSNYRVLNTKQGRDIFIVY